MGAMKHLLEEQDVRDECQDCGGPYKVIQMGRRWCDKCWEAFIDEYEMFLMMDAMESSNEA